MCVRVCIYQEHIKKEKQIGCKLPYYWLPSRKAKYIVSEGEKGYILGGNGVRILP